MPFGIVGARLYHVIIDGRLYVGPDAPNRPIDTILIWSGSGAGWRGLNVWGAVALGGLDVWGAVALGGVGVWIACHRRGVALSAVADTVAPAVAVGQAVGRWRRAGRWHNYFNQ
ncbi:prolipoprotein diacylglyceryl transferase family protein [Nonomuraea angiospora]|uniref:prolipoprotein diacylglyceryl transferase family protein n=1 Tax=Nonomuraea angiospora TaxID=46172 RepID=UPI003443F9E7